MLDGRDSISAAIRHDAAPLTARSNRESAVRSNCADAAAIKRGFREPKALASPLRIPPARIPDPHDALKVVDNRIGDAVRA